MSDDKWQWWAGSSEEWMDYGSHETREDAIAEGINSLGRGGGDFVVLEAISHGVPPIDANATVNNYFEWLNDSTDFYSGENGCPDWMLPADQQRIAEAELQIALDAWSAKWLQGYVDPMPDQFAATRSIETIHNTRDPNTESGGHDNPRETTGEAA